MATAQSVTDQLILRMMDSFLSQKGGGNQRKKSSQPKRADQKSKPNQKKGGKKADAQGKQPILYQDAFFNPAAYEAVVKGKEAGRPVYHRFALELWILLHCKMCRKSPANEGWSKVFCSEKDPMYGLYFPHVAKEAHAYSFGQLRAHLMAIFNEKGRDSQFLIVSDEQEGTSAGVSATPSVLEDGVKAGSGTASVKTQSGVLSFSLQGGTPTVATTSGYVVVGGPTIGLTGKGKLVFETKRMKDIITIIDTAGYADLEATLDLDTAAGRRSYYECHRQLLELWVTTAALGCGVAGFPEKSAWLDTFSGLAYSPKTSRYVGEIAISKTAKVPLCDLNAIDFVAGVAVRQMSSAMQSRSLTAATPGEAKENKSTFTPVQQPPKGPAAGLKPSSASGTHPPKRRVVPPKQQGSSTVKLVKGTNDDQHEEDEEDEPPSNEEEEEDDLPPGDHE